MKLSALLILITAAATASGQQFVHGRVTDRASGFPLAGVVVSGLDATGAPLSRTVTDSASGYRVLILPGMTHLHFRRIGFAPARVALADTVNGGADVALTRLPTQLPPVKALASAQCDPDPNAGEALSLWEEARSALLTSLVARETKAAFISVLAYQTTYDGDDEQPRAVMRHQIADASHAFVAGDPKEIARTGYLDRSSFAREEYIGPDEQVLADESFLATHCFRIAEAPDDSTLALGFTPAKGRKVVEIEGTVFLRRDPLDLKSIEFRYVNIPSNLLRARPGGAIYLRKMPSGVTMVQEWRVRSASETPRGSRTSAMRTTARRGSVGNRVSPPAAIRRDSRLDISESGALIELMQWPGAPTFIVPLATVSGIAVERVSKQPLANTQVRLYSTPFVALTDSTGAFTMIDVLPGIYRADVGDPHLEAYGAAGELVGPIAIRFGENRGLRLEGDGPQTTVLRGCAEKIDGMLTMPGSLAGAKALFGRITDSSGYPARERDFQAEVYPAGLIAGAPGFPMKGKTDKSGLFRLCNLPAGSIKLLSADRRGTASAEVSLLPETPFQLITLKVVRRP